MLKADEDGRMPFLYKELLLYIFKCNRDGIKWKWDREAGHFLTKISNFIQFNNKEHFLAM